MHRNLDNVSTKRRRIAELAKQSPEMVFTSLAYHLDLDWLREAYRRTRKDGATGIDAVTAREYAVSLEDNLQSLLNRAKSGRYQAPPVRRVRIPKGNSGETRPIGIPTFEDKVLQRAVVMLLESIYEQDFSDSSYGFRPRRSAHDALQSFWEQATRLRGCWVLEVDISKFFDNLDHDQLRLLLRRRVRDGVLLRLIDKWLGAGVMENGKLSFPDSGSPQGGVISPLLANVYLHYVLDLWFHQEVQPRLRGRTFLIRYADDFVIGFAREEDAYRVMDVLPKRFAKYGLTVHPDKTRLVRFSRPPQAGLRAERPETFDFLGFTHYWGKSHRGNWVLKRKTASSRLRRGLLAVRSWCRLNRHQQIGEQHVHLARQLRGHYAYYGITNNQRSLQAFREQVRRIWRTWLSRRNREESVPWEVFERIEQRFPLPPPRIVHSYITHAAKS
jgi:RNA-directed DNA polymerase